MRDASMVHISERDASVTPHAVPKVNAEPKARPTSIAVRTMENRPRPVVVEVADLAKILGKALHMGFAGCVDAAIIGGLQSGAFHANDFLHGIPVERFVLVSAGHFAFLLAANPARVKPSRNGMAKLAWCSSDSRDAR